MTDPLQLTALFFVGAIASGINTVAGGGSLISFPVLLFFGIPSKIANATNSVGLWPGSMGGALGYREQLPKTKHHFKLLALPTLLGSAVGSWLLVLTDKRLFDSVVPFLLLAAALLLWFQPGVKRLVSAHRGELSSLTAALLQFFVAVYGGYFGAGMGIMMLAVFTLFMNGTIHEINAVKNWLGVLINVVASSLFLVQHMVLLEPGIVMALGSIVGGFLAARLSLKVDPEKMRVAIAVYGLVAAAYFAWKTWG